MNSASARALQLLARTPLTLKQLSSSLKISYSRAASIAQGLTREGYLERSGRTLLLARNAKTELVKALSSRFSLDPLLAESSGRVLLTLLQPKSPDLIQRASGLSQSAVYGALNTLAQAGVVKRQNSSYVLGDDEDLKSLVSLLKREEAAKAAEPFATVLKTSRSGQILKKVAHGTRAQGALTGFSLFARNGVEYISPYDYIVDPHVPLTPEAVLVHSLASSESRTDRTMCAVYLLKNRPRLDADVCKRLAEDWGVLSLLLDARRMANGIAPEKQDLFLPLSEYTEKARLYGVEVAAAPLQEAGLRTLRDLSERLGVATEAYLFGGANMLLRGLKAATKDLDIIVEDDGSFYRIAQALNSIGFRRLREESLATEDRRLQPSGIYVRNGSPRIDLFTGKVCGALQLTKRWKERAEERGLGNFRLKLLSLEDVFLLKSITDRAGDLDDMAVILRRVPRLDWRSILDTYWEQEKVTGRHFCYTILDNLEILQEREGTRIPIHRPLLQHCIDVGIIEAVERGASTIQEIKALVDFPEHRLRNRITVLVKAGKVQKDHGTQRLKLKPVSPK